MESKELKSKILQGVFYNFSGSLLKNGFTFIISIFLSRILDPSDFGLVGMATVFIVFSQGLSDLGLSSGLIREQTSTDKEMSSVFYFNIGISLILNIVLFFSASSIAFFYGSAEIELIVKAISFTLVLNSLNTVHQAILYKSLDVKKIRIASLVSAIIGGAAGLGAALIGYGVWSLVLSSYVSGIASVLIIWYFSRWRPSLVFDFNDIKRLMPFGIKVFLVNYIDLVYSRLDILLIGKIFNPSILGYYFRAISLNQLVTKYSSQGLSGIFFPAVSKMNGDLVRIKDFYNKTLNAVCFISFLLTGLLYVNAKEMILILFGSKWYPSIDYFKILAFSSYVTPLTLIFNGVLLGTGNSGAQLKLELLKKILSILGIGIGLWIGFHAYLWSLVITTTLGLFLSLVFIKKVIVTDFWKDMVLIFKYTIPMFIGIFVLLGIKTIIFDVNPLVLFTLSTIFYIALFFLFSHILNLSGFKTVINLLFKVLYSGRKFN